MLMTVTVTSAMLQIGLTSFVSRHIETIVILDPLN